jgi:hypothetical protein
MADTDFPLKRIESFTVATVPAAADWKGHLIHVSNGEAGDPCLAYSDGTDWLVVALGAEIAAA